MVSSAIGSDVEGTVKQPPIAILSTCITAKTNLPLDHTGEVATNSQLEDTGTEGTTETIEEKTPVDSVPDASIQKDDSTNSSSKDLEKGDLCPSFCTPPHVQPPSEHFRDIDFLGPITLHRIFVILWVGGSCVLFFYIQRWIWPEEFDVIGDGSLSIAWHLFAAIWLVSLPSSIAALAGALWFRYNTKLDQVTPITCNVVFRIVSRGINDQCLSETIRRCQREMSITPMFPYLIEVVTDADVFDAPDEPDVIQLKVPSDFQPPGGSLFKARALHYASEHSVVPPNTWIVHLDEETRPTPSGLKGIAAMIEECERTGDIRRVGQGPILYHRSFEEYPFLTLADMRRTGDDLGHYYLQHNIGFTLFGLHGAYIVCRQDIEAKIGFDVGRAGSITEDAWWILLAMKEGYRTKWVDGYLEEQSTQSVMDFLRQRRRWYYGLSKVVRRCPVNFKYRMFIFFNTVSWLMVPMLLPFQLVYMILLYRFQLPVALPIRILTIFIVSISLLVYFAGLVPNLREHKTQWWKVPFWMIAMLAAWPFALLMEVIGVFMAFFAPCSGAAKGFHVVQKSSTVEKEACVDHTSSNSGN